MMRRNPTNNIQKNTAAKVSDNYGCFDFSNISFYGDSLEHVPTMITEDVAVIAVADYGCVGESSVGGLVVVPDCDASAGDIVSVTFYIPAGEINIYLEELDRRQNSMVDAWDKSISDTGFSA